MLNWWYIQWPLGFRRYVRRYWLINWIHNKQTYDIQHTLTNNSPKTPIAAVTQSCARETQTDRWHHKRTASGKMKLSSANCLKMLYLRYWWGSQSSWIWRRTLCEIISVELFAFVIRRWSAFKMEPASSSIKTVLHVVTPEAPNVNSVTAFCSAPFRRSCVQYRHDATRVSRGFNRIARHWATFVPCVSYRQLLSFIVFI